MAKSVSKGTKKKRDRWVDPASRSYEPQYLHRLYIGANPMIGEISKLTGRSTLKNELSEIVIQLEAVYEKLKIKEDKALINSYNTLKGKDGKQGTTKIKEMLRIMSSIQSAAEEIKDSIIEDFMVEGARLSKGVKTNGSGNQLSLKGAQETISDIVSKAVKGTGAESKFKNASTDILERMTNALLKADTDATQKGKTQSMNTAVGYLMEDIYATLGESMLSDELTREAEGKIIAETIGNMTKKGINKANKKQLKAKNTIDITFSLSRGEAEDAMKGALDVSLKSKVSSQKQTVNLKTDTSSNTILDFAGQQKQVKEAIAFALVHQHAWSNTNYQNRIRAVYSNMEKDERHKKSLQKYTTSFMSQFGDKSGASYEYAIEKMQFNNTFEALRPVINILSLNAMIFAIKGYASVITKGKEDSLFTVILGKTGSKGVKGGLVRSSDMIRGVIEGVKAGMAENRSNNYLDRGIQAFAKVKTKGGTNLFSSARDEAYKGSNSRYNKWKTYTNSALSTDAVLDSVKLQISLNYGKLEKTLKTK